MGAHSSLPAHYVVRQAGTYLMEVKYDGVHIRGSPFTVVAAAPAGATPEGLSKQHARLALCGSLHEKLRGGYWSGDEWRLPHCRIRQLSFSESEACLAKRNVIFVGDSLTRAAFWCFLTWTKGHTTLSHFDGYACRYEYWLQHISAKMQFQCAWDSALRPFFHWMENRRAYVDGSFVRATPEWLGLMDAAANNMTGRDPDVVVLGVGAHDMVVDDIDAFRANLHEAVRLILSWPVGPGLPPPKVVWVGVSAAEPVALGQQQFKHYRHIQSYPRVARFNRVAAEVMEFFDVPVLDLFAMSYPRPELTFDGQHYTRSPDVLNDPVYMNLRAALLHEICP